MPEKVFQSQDEISETLLIPLYVRAKETRRPDALMRDERALALVQQIDYDFSQIKLQSHDLVAIILRVREFDRFGRVFLQNCPDAAVVHIGCGLDTRFERLDNGRVEWYDLDLPEVIALRQKLLGSEKGRCHTLACSVFDHAWMEALASQHRPTLFLAEGVFPYFTEAQVKSLVLDLRDHFPGSELVFDAHRPLTIFLDNLQLALSGLRARLHWGMRGAWTLESWGEGIRLLEEWYYFDRPEPRFGSFRWMRYIVPLAKSTGIFHYRLG